MTKKNINYKIDSNDLDWKAAQIKGFFGKEIIQHSKGGVKLIKIEPFSVYPEHIHPDRTEFAYVVSGNPEFSIDDQFFIGKTGDFFVFPSDIKHAIKNNTAVECFLLIGAIKNESVTN